MATSCYVKLNKGIKGPVTTKGYEDHIEISNFNMGLAREIESAVGGNKSRETTAAQFLPIVLTKEYCVASPKLFLASVGPLDHEVEIKFVTTGAGKAETFVTWKLENVGIGGYHVNSGPDGKLMETITLHYDKITITHTGYGPDVTGTPETVGYDLKTRAKT